MLKRLYKFLKKTVTSFFMLYSYNVMVPASAIIPINLVTVILLTFFNIPALLGLIIIKILIY